MAFKVGDIISCNCCWRKKELRTNIILWKVLKLMPGNDAEVMSLISKNISIVYTAYFKKLTKKEIQFYRIKYGI